MDEVRSVGARALAKGAGVLAACVLLAALAVGFGVEKAHALTTEDGWKYQVNTWAQEPVVQLLGYEGDQTEVVVPKEIDGYPVAYAYLDYGHTVKSLDASGCENLVDITVYTGKLERLNVSGCTSLEYLTCENNALSSLDISGCSALKSVRCKYNYIEDLTALKAWDESHKGEMYHSATLEPQFDQTTGFAYTVGDSFSPSFGTVEEHGHGAYVTGWDGRSAQVELPAKLGGADVVYADLSYRSLEGLDVSGCPTLRKLVCSYNYLADTAALEAWGAQDGHEVVASPQFDAATGFAYEVRDGEQGHGAYAIEFDYRKPRETIVMPATVQGEPLVSISSHIIMCDFLDLTQCRDLKSFVTGYSGIAALDASGLMNLTHFVCEASGTYALDVSSCPSLVHFSCNENSLTSLTLDNSPSLRYLDCSRNMLSSLDLAAFPQLEDVRCNDNALTSLDISALSKLVKLRCANNYLSDLSALEAWGAVEGHQPWLTPQKTAAAKPVGIRLDRSVMELAHDGVEQLKATFVPGGTAAQVTWTSSDAAVASVDAAGKVTAVGPGKATVTASTAEGFETKCLVTVLPAPAGDTVTGLTFDQASVEMGFVTECPLCGKSHGGKMSYQSGNCLQLSYSFFDPAAAAGASPEAAVSVANPSVASVSLGTCGQYKPGVQEVYVTALAKGSTTATVTVRNADESLVQAKFNITVSEAKTPSFSMPAERAYRIDEDSTAIVAWYGMGNPDPNDWMNPLAAISYYPGMVTNAGEQEHFYARYLKSVTSDNESVVGIDIDEFNAFMKFKSAGSANVTVTDIWGHTGTTKVVVHDVDASVSVPSLELAVGDVYDLEKAVSGEQYDPHMVRFESADPSVAAVDDHWDDVTNERSVTLKAVAAGETTVKAIYGMGASDREVGTIAVKVTGPVSVPVTSVQLDASALDLYVGAEGSRLAATVLPADAANKAVTWTSSNEKVATVDAEGTVVPVAVGAATITVATVDGGHTATCAVTVAQHAEGVRLDKHEATLVGASTLALKATVAPDNATNKDVSWTSSDEKVVTVDAAGIVTAVGKGSAKVTVATNDGAYTDACAVTVTNPVTGIDLAPSASSLVKGAAVSVTSALRGALPGATDEAGELSWSVSDPSVLRVDETGGVFKGTALKSGTATVTASLSGSSAKGSCTVTVTNPVQSVTLSEPARTLTVGDPSFTLQATVKPADADDTRVTWSSSVPSVASVNASGTVVAHAVGDAIITATAGGVSASCTVTVNAKQIATTPDGSGFSASVTVEDSATAKVLEQIMQQAGGALNLVVAAVEQLTDRAQQAVEQLTANGAKVAETLDIHFSGDDGEEVVVGKDEQGKLEMTVKVKLTDAMKALLDEGLNLQVHYVGEDGTVETMRTWVKDGCLCFVTSHFSDYVVTGQPPQTEGEGGQGGSAAAPLPPTDITLASTDGEPLAPTGDPLGQVATGTAVLLGVAALTVAGALVARRRGASR